MIQFIRRFFRKTPADYLAMQRRQYDQLAERLIVEPGQIIGDEHVVGSWQAHDEWLDYDEFMFNMAMGGYALEFGCGPGRNLWWQQPRFSRIDGVDISLVNLKNARKFCGSFPSLYLTDGFDCGGAPHEFYDFAFSTICLQHICVWSIRNCILANLFQCLKPGGRLAIQMGYGIPSPQTVDYYAEYTEAKATNRACDVAISSPDQVQKDLEMIGFTNFEYWIRPVGPGDLHPNWIFFTAVKPLKAGNL
jgi:SAM-dependent methyltransferase